MNASQIYIIISIVALAFIVITLFAVRGKRPRGKISTLGFLGSLLVLAGVMFSNSRFIGYGLMVIGGILALVDIIRKFRKPFSV